MLRVRFGGFAYMPAYRLYYLDGTGKVASAEWLDATDDDTALALARDLCKTRRCELWDRQRLIARWGPGGQMDAQAS